MRPGLSTLFVFLLSTFPNLSLGQQPAQSPGIDPLALDVLRATTDSLKNAKTFSFRAMVAKERLGTNDQIITLFRLQDVTVSRPNKMRVHLQTENNNVDIYYNGTSIDLFSPDKKLYTSIAAVDSLDKMVDGLESRGVDMPVAPLLRSDPYKTITDGLQSAAVIGRVMIEGKTFHQLAFTEKDSEWQLWVQAGAKPTPRHVEIIYKNMPRQPRITIDFSNWNLNAAPAADFFTFHKPADAKAITFMNTGEGQNQ